MCYVCAIVKNDFMDHLCALGAAVCHQALPSPVIFNLDMLAIPNCFGHSGEFFLKESITERLTFTNILLSLTFLSVTNNVFK